MTNRRTFLSWLGAVLVAPFMPAVKAEASMPSNEILRIADLVRGDSTLRLKKPKHPFDKELDDLFQYFTDNCPEPPDDLPYCDLAEFYVVSFSGLATRLGWDTSDYTATRLRILRSVRFDNGMTAKSVRDDLKLRYCDDAKTVNKLLTEFVVKHSGLK